MSVIANKMRWHSLAIRLLACVAFVAVSINPALGAPKVGEVTKVHGVVTVQQKDEGPRFIAQGEPLQQGDVLVTSNRGFAIIGLQDDTKKTLRPNTTFSIDEYAHGTGKENAVFSLVRGGLRSITGLISNDPDAMKIRAKSATMAVREPSSFDARLCETDCAAEAEVNHSQKPEIKAGNPIVGKVAQLQGVVSAIGLDGKARTLSRGAPLFSEDKIQTVEDSYAVLAFRDQSKMTVTPNSIVALENVKFEGKDASEGSFSARLIKGGLRAFTGLLGKHKPEAVQFKAVTAVIGIRGTGLDMSIGEQCLGAGVECSSALFTYIWDGAVGMDAEGRSLLVELGRAGVYVPARHQLYLLDNIPEIIKDEGKLPRPDQVDVDFDNLFGEHAIEFFTPGLYVFVRDGHIELIGEHGSIDLGPGESGYLDFANGVPVRLSSAPPFLLNDLFPTPDNPNVDILSILEMFNPGAAPGDDICEIK